MKNDKGNWIKEEAKPGGHPPGEIDDYWEPTRKRVIEKETLAHDGGKSDMNTNDLGEDHGFKENTGMKHEDKEPGRGKTKIFVYNVSPLMEKHKLKMVFSKYDTVVNVINPGRGYAFVTYTTSDGADKAIKHWNNRYIEGRRIKCKPAAPTGRSENR